MHRVYTNPKQGKEVVPYLRDGLVDLGKDVFVDGFGEVNTTDFSAEGGMELLHGDELELWFFCFCCVRHGGCILLLWSASSVTGSIMVAMAHDDLWRLYRDSQVTPTHPSEENAA